MRLLFHPEDADARILIIAFATVCFAFFAGATIGAVCTLHFHNHAAWIVTGWLALGTLPLVRPGARANADLDQAAGI